MHWRSRFRMIPRELVAAAMALTLWSAGMLGTPLSAHADGWSGTNRLPVALQNQVALTDGTYLYIAGGANQGAKSGVYSALINSNGTLGTWQTLPSMPQGLFNHAGALQNGRLFILGGQNSGSAAQSAIYTAAQQTGGGLSAWSTNATPLPQALFDHAAVAAGGFVFVLGGFGSNNTARATVYSAPQTGTGLGAWTAQTALPVAEGEIGADVLNGHIYVVGGHTVTGSGGGQATVYMATIGANGSVGAWQTLTPLPQARWDVAAVVGGGFLWATGGYNASGKATNSIYRAPINADGTIGAWLALTPTQTVLGEHTATAAKGDLFLAGGKVGSNGASSTIYAAPLAGPWLMLSTYGVNVGSKVQVKGTGFTAGETVNVTFAGGAVATAHADASGSFGINGAPGTSFVVPSSTATGTYPVTGTGQTSGHFGQAMLKVTGTAIGPGGDWTHFLFDDNHTGYNPTFTAFGTSNAANLTQKWKYTTGGLLAGNPAVAAIHNPTATACTGSDVPMAFVGGWNGKLYGINATTGTLCWVTTLAQDVQPNPNQFCINTLGITSAPTVITLPGTSTQVVYAGASDIMFAVNAATGQIMWHTAVAGQDIGTFSDAYIWSSPVYSPGNNTLYTSTASFCDETSPVDGTMYALNPATGAIKAQFAPSAGTGSTGSGIWGTPTVSASQQTVYITTGNAFVTTANGTEQACPANVALSCAVVALDWNTLQPKSSWQITPNTLDLDFGTTPVLFPGPAGATWLAAGSKDGWLYVLDSANLAAGPKWRIQLAKGGGNPILGIIAPTAYFPGTANNGAGTSCTGVLIAASGNTTLNGTAFGGSISALCAQSGQVLWRQGTAGLIWAAPAVANGLVATQQGATTNVRNLNTGAVLFSFTAGHNIYAEPTFANGMLYIASTDHALYAFGL